jgi:hypothetical protein
MVRQKEEQSKKQARSEKQEAFGAQVFCPPIFRTALL